MPPLRFQSATPEEIVAKLRPGHRYQAVIEEVDENGLTQEEVKDILEAGEDAKGVSFDNPKDERAFLDKAANAETDEDIDRLFDAQAAEYK